MSGKQKVVLGTATPGGGFPLYGGVASAAMMETDPGLEIENRNTKGSTENVPLLEAGQIDLGLVQGEVAHEAIAGIGRAPAKMFILAAMYSTAGMFITRKDSGIKSIADLKGKPVAFGARGSGLVILSRYVLDGLGLKQDEDFQAIYLDKAGDGPAMVLDGRAAALWGGGVGWPGFTAVASGPAGAKFITPSADEAKRILQKHDFLKPLTVAPGAYPGQDFSIASVGSWSFIMTRPDLPDELAYRLARALHKAEPGLPAKLDQARETTAANTLAAAPRVDLIHPGVRKYLREIGLAA